MISSLSLSLDSSPTEASVICGVRDEVHELDHDQIMKLVREVSVILFMNGSPYDCLVINFVLIQV